MEEKGQSFYAFSDKYNLSEFGLESFLRHQQAMDSPPRLVDRREARSPLWQASCSFCGRLL
jgi:hypothetical protein